VKKYETPGIQYLSFFCSIPVTQYVFVITPNVCPSLSADGAVGTEEGLAFCAPTVEPSSGFSAVIACQNISGTYHAVYGDAVAGGGLSCGSETSVVYPLISLTPDLPENCIVDSFIRNGSFDDCRAPG
jgi:hypothetical protein